MNPLVLVAAIAGTNAIEPVVVTATRTESPLDKVLASVDIISSAELRRQPAADLGDLLRMRAGVEVARLGGPGQQTSLFLRGTDSNHVLVLVDGVRINPGTIGSAAIQNIAPELVERVEIVKGPRSTLYGSDALGGVINVITRRGAANGASVQAGIGSFDSRSASFNAGVGGTRGDASLGVSWVNSDGFPTRSGDATDRGYENLSLTAAARTDLAGVDLGVRAWYAEGTSEYSDFFVTPVDQDFENSAFALTAGFAPTESWRSRLSLAHVLDAIDQNQLDAFDQNQVADFLRTRRWQLDWQNDIAVSANHALTAGILWQDEEADAESFDLPYTADTATRQFYLQDQMSIGRAQVLLAAGFVDHETFGSHVTWNAEFGFALGDATMLTLAAGRAFRAPDATDLYGFGGNATLDPERSDSYEASLRHDTAGGQRFSLTLFRNEIDDLIGFVVTNFATFDGENRNIERARIDGLEASWRYHGERWAARATATLQDPRDLVTDERLLRRAEENFTLGVARRFGAHEIAVDLLYAGDREDFGFPQVRMPAYWLANISASVAVNERWTLLARMENLLDEDYELARGFNTMGRSLFVAARHEFR